MIEKKISIRRTRANDQSNVSLSTRKKEREIVL